jgi:hypothetical protein
VAEAIAKGPPRAQAVTTIAAASPDHTRRPGRDGALRNHDNVPVRVESIETTVAVRSETGPLTDACSESAGKSDA